MLLPIQYLTQISKLMRKILQQAKFAQIPLAKSSLFYEDESFHLPDFQLYYRDIIVMSFSPLELNLYYFLLWDRIKNKCDFFPQILASL